MDPGRAAWLAAAALAVLMPFWLPAAELATATFVVIAAIGAVGLNILTGVTGQISIGHAFFLAVGATVAGLLSADAGLGALLWLPAAGLVAAAFGALVGPVALRLTGLYLAVVTIGLVFIGQYVLLNVPAHSGGPAGQAYPAVTIGSLDFAQGQELDLGGIVIGRDGLYYFLGLAILALSLLFARNLMRSRTGRGMRAVASRELVASLMGIGVARVKIAAFAASSFLGGVCGALYVSYLSYAQPGQWSLALSIQFLAAIIIGGMGTLSGPVVGSVVVFAAPTLLAHLPIVESSGGSITSAQLAELLYGGLIIAFLVFEPRGLVGLWSRLVRRNGRTLVPPAAATATVASPAAPGGDLKEEIPR